MNLRVMCDKCVLSNICRYREIFKEDCEKVKKVANCSLTIGRIEIECLQMKNIAKETGIPSERFTKGGVQL